MHAISALASGVRGAENGYVRIFNRATSTYATFYSDFAGTAHADSGGETTLDGDGSAIIYVNQYVDVRVYDSTGELLRQWTDGYTANSIELKSTAVVGTDYDTLQQATGKPLSVEAWANKWGEAAADGGAAAAFPQVKVGSTTDSLPDWLGALQGLVYNVQSPAYGAVGDGATDDQAAIQAAITAAQLKSGGIVFLPAGTYWIESALTLSNKVTIMGAGPNATALLVNHATAHLFEATANTYPYASIRDIRIGAAQSNSGNTINSFASRLLCDNVYFDSTNLTGSTVLATTGQLMFRGCTFLVGGATATALNVQMSSGRCVVDGGRVIPPATCNSTNGLVYGNRMDLRGVYFETGTSTSGTYDCIAFSNATVLGSVHDCTFETSGGATVTAVDIGSYAAASKFRDSGNVCPGQEDTNFTLYTALPADEGADVQLRTREGRVYLASSDDASLLVDLMQWGTVLWRKSGTTSITNFGHSTGDYAPEGVRTLFAIHNLGGGSIASVGSTSVDGVTGTAIQDNRSSVWLLQTLHNGSAFFVAAVSENEDIA